MLCSAARDTIERFAELISQPSSLRVNVVGKLRRLRRTGSICEPNVRSPPSTSVTCSICRRNTPPARGSKAERCSVAGAAELLKEWTLLTQLNVGTGMPETPLFPAAVPGTGWIGPLRPSLTGAPIYGGQNGAHLNAAAYAAPAPGTWGTAGRNSITRSEPVQPRRRDAAHVPSQQALLSRRAHRRDQSAESSLSSAAGTRRWKARNLACRESADPMRSLQATMRVRF